MQRLDDIKYRKLLCWYFDKHEIIYAYSQIFNHPWSYNCLGVNFLLFLLELFSCSKDKSIHVTDLNTGALQCDISQAHGYAWLFSSL